MVREDGSHGRTEVHPGVPGDAVALWRASAGQRTVKDVAADLGITRETLRLWARSADGGSQDPADGSRAQDHRDELAQLRAENARLQKADEVVELLGVKPDRVDRGSLTFDQGPLQSSLWIWKDVHAKATFGWGLVTFGGAAVRIEHPPPSGAAAMTNIPQPARYTWSATGGLSAEAVTSINEHALDCLRFVRDQHDLQDSYLLPRVAVMLTDPDGHATQHHLPGPNHCHLMTADRVGLPSTLRPLQRLTERTLVGTPFQLPSGTFACSLGSGKFGAPGLLPKPLHRIGDAAQPSPRGMLSSLAGTEAE